MRRLQTDAPGPGQDLAPDIIELAHTLQEQNIIATRWVPGHRVAAGNELARERQRSSGSQTPGATQMQHEPASPS